MIGGPSLRRRRRRTQRKEKIINGGVPDDGSTPKNVHYDRLSTTMDACVVEVENTKGMLVKSR